MHANEDVRDDILIFMQHTKKQRDDIKTCGCVIWSAVTFRDYIMYIALCRRFVCVLLVCMRRKYLNAEFSLPLRISRCTAR